MIARGGGLHGGGNVGGDDLVLVAGHFVQRVSGDEGGQLVIGKGKYVCRGRRIFHVTGFGIRLAHHAKLDFKGLVSVGGFECVHHFLQHGLIFLGAPDLQFDGFGREDGQCQRQRQAQYQSQRE